MPRHPDPDLEERILHAADVLWRRGAEKSLTMRAVARAARTSTPAVYRRFKGRRDLVKALLLRIAHRMRKDFEECETIQDMTERYVEYAIRMPNEYLLSYSHAGELSPLKAAGPARPIRDSRPNFALLEHLLAKRSGGRPEDHTQQALEIWAVLHGTTMLILQKSIPEGHEEHLREACRAAVRVLLKTGRKNVQPN